MCKEDVCCTTQLKQQKYNLKNLAAANTTRSVTQYLQRLSFYAVYISRRIVTSAKAKVMRSACFVCHSVCVQYYCKSSLPISFELGVMIGPTGRKNWLIFGGDPVPDTDSGPLFHFPHHCGIVDFRRFISISYSVAADTRRNSWRRQGNESTAFGQISGSESEYGNVDSNPRSLLVDVRRLGGGLRSLSTVYMYVTLFMITAWSYVHLSRHVTNGQTDTPPIAKSRCEYRSVHEQDVHKGSREIF